MEVERLIVEQHALETAPAISTLFQTNKPKNKKTKYVLAYIVFFYVFAV